MDLEATGHIDKFGKKEGIILRKRRAKLEKNLSGIATMPTTPDVLFVIDTKAEHIAVKRPPPGNSLHSCGGTRTAIRTR